MAAGWKTQHCPLRHPTDGEVARSDSHTSAGAGVPPPPLMLAKAGAALANNIAVMTSTTVANTIKRRMRRMRHLLIPTLPTGAPCVYCSEGYEDGATSEKTSFRHFGE